MDTPSPGGRPTPSRLLVLVGAVIGLVVTLLIACSDQPVPTAPAGGAHLGGGEAPPPATDAEARAAAGGQTLRAVVARGSLRVATRNAPTTWYLDRHGQNAGPEYDLVAAFAKHLGVAVSLVVRETTTEVLAAVDAGEADLAAAGLTATDSRSGSYLFGPTYKSVSEQLVCHREGPRVSELSQLARVEVVVAAGSSYVETLQALAVDYPDLSFTEDPRHTEALLAAVAEREIDCTVADSHVVAINRRYHPPLVVGLPLSEDEQLVWMMAEGAAELQAALVDWFLRPPAQERRREVEKRYYALAKLFDYVELRAFQRRLRSRFPRYQALFEDAAREYSLDPALLAAQAYQESGWDPAARSPTGVRGIMMLTQRTARSVGVTDRLDPAQSIEGGARYLARMRERFDDAAAEPDRTYLALAAYNIGRGHMHDAQSLARARGGDPLVWQDVKAVLPLLADREVYPTLQHGYARGTEPVRYVERIRSYEDILLKSLTAASAAAPSAVAAGGER